MAARHESTPRESTAAEALLSGLTDFSVRAGHDLIGPLNQAASLLTLFIKRYRNQLDPDADKLLDFLESASARMEVMVGGVRRYMEIAGKPPNFAPVDLNTSLADACAALEKSILQNGAVIECESLPMVSADPAQMATIFELLISNAIKFRKRDETPRIQISFLAAGEAPQISILDNGIGIDPEHAETVFLPFKRLNGVEYPGAGLGLATAKLITAMHGGHIRLGSDLSGTGSRGTCVQFTLGSRSPNGDARSGVF